MKVVYIKNISEESKILNGKQFAIDEEYSIPHGSISMWMNDATITAIGHDEFQIGNGTDYIAAYVDQIAYLGSEVPAIVSNEPFAVPDYRTKRNGGAKVDCPANSSTNIDFQLTEELYVHGGEIGVKNAEVGDYVTAEICDKDSVIPEAYRSALCENWPSVASYVNRHNVKPIYSGIMNAKEILSTYPLNAKISAGLYMRLTYHAANVGSTREAVVDYYFSKKL